MSWKTIDDDKVVAVWECQDPFCNCESSEVRLPPTFYQEAGVPMCEEGGDMTYVATEISD